MIIDRIGQMCKSTSIACVQGTGNQYMSSNKLVL